MPKVSIIMPNYNCSKFIRQAVDSILNQTLKDFELVICDDCSTDNSVEIINEYTKNYPNKIRMVSTEKNSGEPTALNTALDNISKESEYYCILDSDDLMEPNRLEFHVQWMDSHKDVDMSYGDGYYCDEEGNKWDYNVFPFNQTMLMRFNMVPEGACLWRHKVLDIVGKNDTNCLRAEDWDFLLRCVKKGIKIQKIESVRLYTWRQHGGMKSGHTDDMEKALNYIREKHGLKQKLVTIGVPVHDQKIGYLEECFRSIKNLSYRNYEVIVVDNGSKNRDEVRNLTESYGFRYIYIEQIGIGIARNMVIDNASGESDYICYISSDDALMPNYVDVMMNSEGSEDEFLYSDYYMMNQNGLITHEYRCPVFPTYEDFVIACIEFSERNTMAVCYNIWGKTRLWKMNRFDDSYTHNEDLEHMLRTMLVEKVKFMHVPFPLFSYRICETMTTSVLGMQKINENNIKTRRKINRLLGKEVFKNV